MAEVQGSFTLTNGTKPTSDTVSREKDDANRMEVKSLESRYIELLEEKIARLVADTKVKKDGEIKETSETSKSDDKTKSASTETAEDTKPEENSNAKQNKNDAKKSRVRYVDRKLDSYGEFEDTEVDAFNDIEEKAAAKRTIDEEDPGKEEGDDYAIAWRRSVSAAQGGRGMRELLIESAILRTALKTVTEGYSRLSFDTDEVSFSAPYEVIYHNTEKLREYAKNQDERTKADIEILLTEVDMELATKLRDIRGLAQNGQVTFDLLWTLFYPGCLVCHHVMGEVQISVFSPVSIGYYDDKSKYYIELWGIDYDGEDFVPSQINVAIDSFKGPKAFTDLEVYPVDKWTDPAGIVTPEALKEKLSKRGQTFEELCTAKVPDKYRSYGGLALIEGEVEMVTDSGSEGDGGSVTMSLTGKMRPKGQNGNDKLNDKSAVMIDHYAYLKYGKMAQKLGRHETLTPCSCKSCAALRNASVGELPRAASERNKYARLNDLQRQVCPPRVFGFDVRQKLWVQLLVDSVEKISQTDKDEAFKKLVLPTKTKDLLKTLVTEHAKNASPLDDLIPGKGNGLIVLLHGPPGVGKTLTAESLAMLSGKPLYSVTISDIGTSPSVVEQNLIRIFELATHWNAILLFDEADVFLEKRSLKDLRRNSLVSTLLRILEYFSGILFLTSNRVKTFDEAFQSRIHLAVQYTKLGPPQRRAIWELWLQKAGDNVNDIEKFKSELEEGGDLVAVELNGRQIRNCFRSGMALAKARPLGERKVRYTDVENMVKKTGELMSYMMQSEAIAAYKGER